MKSSFLRKSLYIFVIVALLFIPLMPSASNLASASTITNVNVSVYPASPYVNAMYTISFISDTPQPNITIIIGGLQVSQAPSNQSISVITLNNSSVPLATCNTSGGTGGNMYATIIISSASIRSGSNVITIPTTANIFNPSAGSYNIGLDAGSGPVYSSYYQIGTSQISNLSVQVNPPLENSSAQYLINFTTSANGPLTANTNNIYVKFPLGTGMPSSVQGSYVTVNSIPCTGTLTVDVVNRTLTIPVPLNIYANSNVAVNISNQALIINPQSSGSYTLIAWTTSDSTNMTSNAYNISSSFVSSVTVSANPATVNSAADYTIQFTTSSGGALTANVDTISIGFPSESTVPSSGFQASNILVNNQPCSNVTASGNTLTITTPVSVGASSSVTVIISKAFGITNPVQQGNYEVQVNTSQDLSPIESESFSISATTLSSVYVVATPSIINSIASYMIQFKTGSEGALAQGDFIKVVFPQGSFTPQTIQASAISVNGSAASSVSSSPSDLSITINLPQNFSLSGGGNAVVSISNSAGIKNPSTPSDSYYVSVATSAESTLVKSSNYSVYGAPTTTLTVSPDEPDGLNGYYVSKPQITLKTNDIPGVSILTYYRIDQGNETVYSAPFTLDEGTHTVYYYSKTSAGLTETEKSMEFKVDLTPPSLTISSPKEGEAIYQNPVQITGTTETGATLAINSQQVSVDSNGNFLFAFSATEGVNNITAIATDGAGNAKNVKLSFTYITRVVILLQVDNKTAYLNNSEISLDAAPFVYKGRVMVPLRFLSDSLHASVEWDQIFKIATVTLGSLRIRVQVGNNTADVGGNAVALDVPPVIVNSRVFVPIRFISENFGSSVDWDSKMQIVKIVYPKQQG